MQRAGFVYIASILAVGCGAPDVENASVDEKLSSALASFVDFTWEGEVYDANCFRPSSAIDQQLLYTVGQLNGDKSVGRLDQVVISNVETEDTARGCRISYDARMPVAWGRQTRMPQSYELVMPRDVSWDGVERFVEKYTKDCLDWRAQDVTPDVFWYYYRPELTWCGLDEDDVVRANATITPSAEATEGMYPEYHKVWEDGALNVVAIFGKAKEDGGVDDVGAEGFRNFANLVMEELGDSVFETVPADFKVRLEAGETDAIIRAELADGKTVNVHIFLIESVNRAPNRFWSAYEDLTPKADYIIYNGHSGLGANIRTLARRGRWSTGQYAIVFMNGCDTYAYVDAALADAHSAVNDDDPAGTKYLDMVSNAMPSMFISMPEATMAIFKGLLSYEAPLTYEAILAEMSERQVALVTGENDNAYRPGLF